MLSRSIVATLFCLLVLQTLGCGGGATETTVVAPAADAAAAEAAYDAELAAQEN